VAKSNFVFKVSAFRLDTRAQTGAPLSDCHISNTLIKFTVTSRWQRRYTVKAVHVDNSGSTSRSIISCLGPEISVQINRILTKFCSWKLGVLVIMTHRVQHFDWSTHFRTAHPFTQHSKSYVLQRFSIGQHPKSAHSVAAYTSPCNTCSLDPRDSAFQTACQLVQPFSHSSEQGVLTMRIIMWLMHEITAIKIILQPYIDYFNNDMYTYLN